MNGNKTKITGNQKNFICSDLHIGHSNILRYDNRPFQSIEEHDSKLLENWNDTVGQNDHVYFIGDWCFNQSSGIEFAKRCNGKIFFIMGNHDHKHLKHPELRNRFEWVQDYHELSLDGQLICLFHYEIAEWNGCHRGSMHLFGHSHKRYAGDSRKFNVGINLLDYRPVLLQDVVRKLENCQPTQHH